ncbi:long-chain fatty acid--CoA ligase [Bradyrhizobium sp. CCBAU 53351]|uniref:AMP-binding protein n=1 Tax=Bradyrhizobium sp. CCBAU 53351 TaxID=1325114 RepID=UPI001888A4B8|nr:AMP-binding protein [Bradyrhizobium sp. CCBAU 53351]QOZ77709.1 long-chain fatty acid--CoA ligase [Bradyrhizobium sp. CCBAU 53351]
MGTTKLLESYWPADTTRAIIDASIGTTLAKTAAEVPNRVALIEVVPASVPSPVNASRTDRHWTYSQLQDDASRCASWLLAKFKTGDRICVWAPNVPEWVILQYGAALAGVILVTANPAFKPSELELVLRQSKSSALFHLSSFRGVDTGAVAHEMEKLGLKCYAFEGWLDEIRSTPTSTLPTIAPGHAAQIQYTSGTTGRPKGALLHHRGLVTNASYVAARAGLENSVLLSPMPLFHTAGSVMSVLGSMTSRATLVLPLFFDPPTVLQAIEATRAEIMFGVPTMLLALIDAMKTAPRDLSSLRLALSGGAPVSPEIHRRVKDALGLPVVTVFGQTELSPIIAQTSVEDPKTELVHTVGKPLWNVEVRIADPIDLRVRPIGVEGEIQARGYQTMIGYFDAAEDTRQAITTDGWLRTGDLGTLDERGYLRVTGRLKDMIIRGGENIYPVEVEACLLKHPDVADVAVFGAPDEKWGEVVAAVVRLSPNASGRAEKLIEHCRGAMAHHKSPTLWFACNQFPLTASGKVQKFRLREALAAGALDKLD